MNRDELAEDVVVADHEPRRFAAILQVLRDQADRGKREDLVAIADLSPAVDDADAPMRQSRPMRTCSPMVAYGPTIVPSPICAFGCTIAVG